MPGFTGDLLAATPNFGFSPVSVYDILSCKEFVIIEDNFYVRIFLVSILCNIYILVCLYVGLCDHFYLHLFEPHTFDMWLLMLRDRGCTTCFR